jgi:hypothetical protein
MHIFKEVPQIVSSDITCSVIQFSMSHMFETELL